MERKNYQNLQDLLESPSFHNWVHGEPGAHLEFWETWMSQHPDRKALAEQAGLIIKGPPFSFKDRSPDPGIIREEWEKLGSRAAGSTKPPAPVHIRKNARRIGRRSWQVAAAVAFVAALGWLVQLYILNPVVVHQTTFGKQLSILLPDSTKVELNANSRLEYRKRHPRKVWLDGEAFFEVKKQVETGANFLVITNDLTVEVLGTAFNVVEKPYKTEVILQEGRVKLRPKRKAGEEVFMEPGEMAIFSAKADKEVEKRRVQPRPLTSWKEGVLEFDDVTLSQVMQRIEEIYGWRTVYHDEALQSRNISMPLPANDLESALKILAKAIDIQIEKVAEDHVLLLY